MYWPMPELLAALDAFVQEHRRCGELLSKRGGATEGDAAGDQVDHVAGHPESHVGHRHALPGHIPEVREQRDGGTAVQEGEQLQALQRDLDDRLEGLDRLLFRDVHDLARLSHHLDEQDRAVGPREGDHLAITARFPRRSPDKNAAPAYSPRCRSNRRSSTPPILTRAIPRENNAKKGPKIAAPPAKHPSSKITQMPPSIKPPCVFQVHVGFSFPEGRAAYARYNRSSRGRAR